VVRMGYLINEKIFLSEGGTIKLNNKVSGRIFDRLKQEIESDDYGIDGLLADWSGAELNRDTNRIIVRDKRWLGPKYSYKETKRDFIKWLLSNDAIDMSQDTVYQDTILKSRKIIFQEIPLE
jgi:hypothetical protein